MQHQTILSRVLSKESLPNVDRDSLIADAEQCIADLECIEKNLPHVQRARSILVQLFQKNTNVRRIFDDLAGEYRGIREASPLINTEATERIRSFLDMHKGCTARLLALTPTSVESLEDLDDNDTEVCY